MRTTNTQLYTNKAMILAEKNAYFDYWRCVSSATKKQKKFSSILSHQCYTSSYTKRSSKQLLSSSCTRYKNIPMKNITIILPKRKETRKTSGWLIISVKYGETSYSKVVHWPGHPMNSLMPAYYFSRFFLFWSNHSDVFHWKWFFLLFRHFLFLCLHKNLHYFLFTVV